MNGEPVPKDLIVLTADKNCRFALEGVLSRQRGLGIREIAADLFVHPQKDPGVLRHGHDFLRPFARSYEHALVVMDLEGCGREDAGREQLELELEGALAASGWGARASAVVIAPELDNWVWSDSPHVAVELGWTGHAPLPLREWLLQEGWVAGESVKPGRPKEALEAALREVGKPRSSAIYRALAEKVSLTRCSDPAFEKLKTVLHQWFAEK